MATRGKSANVVWELSDEGRVVVDVDSPLRPFGAVPTPARGVPMLPRKDETEPDGSVVDDNLTPVEPHQLPKVPKP